VTRRGTLRVLGLASVTFAAVVLSLPILASRDDAAGRLDRAIVATERLDGLRFELVARVEASGRAAAGSVVSEARMTGEYQAPDRLHVAIEAGRQRRDLVIVGGRQWVDDGAGHHQTVATPVGPLRDARAPLTFLRGSGRATLAGLGLARGVPTLRIRVDLSAGDLAGRLFEGVPVPPDARGIIEVEVGLLDGLVRGQTVEITNSADAFGSGLEQVRTVYRVEYWAHGERQEVREPE